MSEGKVWLPPGPVAEAFVKDATAPISVIMGPVGSGKTVAGLMKAFPYAYRRRPAADGVRYHKHVIIRRLEKDMLRTTIPSWTAWFPRAMGQWSGGSSSLGSHTLTFPHPADGGAIELMVGFISLGEQRMEEALRGLEANTAYIDEMDTASDGSPAWLYSRLGRYRQDCGFERAVFGSCNAPEVDNWVVRDFIDEPQAGQVLFRQPGGLSPHAENRANLPPDYYENLARTMKPFDKKRFVDNIPGLSRGTDPVYEEFDTDTHVSPVPLALLPTRIVVGMDAGGTPSAGIWQRAPNGQQRKLRELSTHDKAGGSITGPHRFGEALAAVLHELLATARGMPAPKIMGYADPSAAYGADTANGEANWIEIVSRVAAIPVLPARTNDPTPREAVYRQPMTRLIDGRTPALQIDPSCRLTIRALQRDYRFGQIAGSNARRTDRPLKNWASHLIEADQYALLDNEAYLDVMQRTDARRAQLRVVRAAPTINPFRKVS